MMVLFLRVQQFGDYVVRGFAGTRSKAIFLCLSVSGRL